ncbi:MAG: TonB-dependent receptor plug domain-containing protein, partial [Cupriavidus sp.]|nr:TonB-dependent receptor plug domain-containing protein [Cupriavidus sp.]
MFSNNNRIPAVRRTPLAALAALIVTSGLASQAMAQDNTAATPAASQPQTLKEVVVTANPLGSDLNEMVAPVSTLGGDALTVRQTSTLGETLNSMPGVTSSYFGPNASRPAIRGLDGDRIKILQSGGTTLDASSLSYDHAVPIDPLVAEKVEVVRGPAALMYGGNALGGVVNVIDNRIPRDPVTGVSGAADVSGTIGGDKGRNASGLLEAGNGTFAVHADAFVRQTSDLKIPGFARSGNLRATQPLPEGQSEPYGTLPNTSSHQEGGSMGGSYTWADGFLGANYSTYRNEYGTPADEDARIKMRQDRIGLAGESRNLAGATNGIIDSVKANFN